MEARKMEITTEQDRRERVTEHLRKAMEDLREASKKATGDVRSGIESAMSRLRDASSTVTPTRDELDTYRDRLVSGTVSLLEAVETEARKRREQLQREGEKPSAAKPSGESPAVRVAPRGPSA
jgi:chromosome segregation ATPase